MESGVVFARLARRAVLAVAIVCLAALLAPWPAFASADPLPEGSWTLVNPWPQANNLSDVATLGPLTAVAVGGSGTVIRTTDGGLSWIVTHPLGEATRDLCFVDSQYGWAVGGSTIMATSDGGETWHKQESPISWGLTQVTFVDRLNGWVLGSNHLIARTQDGGLTWRQQPEATLWRYVELSRLVFVDANTGWAGTWAGRLYKTSDGGVTWALAISVDRALLDMEWLDSQRGWLATSGILYRTVDGSHTWVNVWEAEHVGSYRHEAWFLDVEFANATDGVAIVARHSGMEQLWRTTDGGATWAAVFELPRSQSVHSLSLLPQGSAWAVGGNGYLVTSSDGGSSWRQVSRDIFPRDANPRGLLFTDPAHGWLFSDGFTLHTGDGGRSWREQPLPQIGAFGESRSLYMPSFPDAQHGWMAGNWDSELEADEYIAGIARTIDGGDHWELLHLPGETFPYDEADSISATFRGVVWDLDFRNGRSGWVAASEVQDEYDDRGEWSQAFRGMILSTTDGGRSWIRFRLGLDKRPYYVAATGPSSAVVFVGDNVGGPAFVMSTANGGLSWTRYEVEGSPEGLVFSTPRTGWIVVSYGPNFMLKTTDGGRTWTRPESGLNAAELPIFVDNRRAVCTFQPAGARMVTSDGGETWSEGDIPGLFPEVFGSDLPYRDYYSFVSPSLRWAVELGNHGLWRWTPTGTPLSPVLVD